MKSKDKVCVVSLGCAKNLVDSEHILGWLSEKKYPIVGNLEEADIAVINTCGFLQSAVEEAIRTILEVSERKRKGRLRKLYVVGCFVQRYGYKLRKEIPEVDGWAGPGEIHQITELLQGRKRKDPPFLINRPTYLPDHRTPRVQSTPLWSAYLKIAEGCSHRCSFCLIPKLRGPLRSRSLESLIEETVQMVERRTWWNGLCRSEGSPGSAFCTAIPRGSRTGFWNSWSPHPLCAPISTSPFNT
ncbi:MAG: hypothetical protein MUC98_02360 [Desulfobacterota bacterium]|nr:hypothetical protein [Thermodesulfobacteriota bacterium]